MGLKDATDCVRLLSDLAALVVLCPGGAGERRAFAWGVEAYLGDVTEEEEEVLGLAWY